MDEKVIMQQWVWSADFPQQPKTAAWLSKTVV
eukprot:COSAG06_NODE_32_length_31260_cov_54.706973_9_plen_32_part_00